MKAATLNVDVPASESTGVNRPGHRRPCDSDALREQVRTSLLSSAARDVALVVGVSGGADSTALLLLLSELRDELGLQLTAAHLDHGLRPSSAADADWVASLCASRHVPLRTKRVAPLAEASHVSEESSRRWRREFLLETALASRALWVATAHTSDDQAETVLHRVLRGTGPRGLAGISVTAELGDNVQLIRPLLDVSRQDVERWLTSRGQTWRTDATNLDTRYTRNRIRHTLLPLLRQEFNPQVADAVRRLAKQSRELTDWLQHEASTALDRALLEQTTDNVRLAVASLAGFAPVLIREVFVQIWRRQRWGEQGMSNLHWESLAQLASPAASTQRLQLSGGIDVQLDGGVIRLRRMMHQDP